MFNRPRCRDWTPLATQQLRLRNLIKVLGQNIECQPKCQLYYTLHSTTMSAPFFTSEKVEAHGGITVNWPEINCQMMLKSNATCIWIRVWQHMPPECDSLDGGGEGSSNSTQRNDKMLFIWGVYFSGLILITKKSEAKFLPNSLSFQMHGGYFASPDTLAMETVREQFKTNCLSYESFDSPVAVSLPKEKSPKKFGSNNDASMRTATKSCDISSSISSSDIVSIKTITRTPVDSDDFQINSPRASRSCSPVRGEFVDVYPIKSVKDLLAMLKSRYVELHFLKSEVRHSYNLDKLLKLQEKQRKFKYKSEYAKEVTEKICTRSAFCLNLELITSKGVMYRPRGNPSMGRTLNRLLFEENVARPEDILRAQELRRQIETARFRSKLLIKERDRTKMNLRHLETKLSALHDANIETGSWLMSHYRSLSKERESLLQDKIALINQGEAFWSLQRNIKITRDQLCSELKEIYPIECKNSNYFILDVFLPVALDPQDDYKLDYVEHITGEHVSPQYLSVALGYVAHVVQMCSVILDLPLRNPIKHEGSRSQILDVIKDLPFTSREFPLYSRTNPPPKSVLYAIYLLNQNIAQLSFQFKGYRPIDLRFTLSNLLKLLGAPNLSRDEVYVDFDDDINQITSACGSSVDLNVPVPPVISKPVDVVELRTNDQRISRSVGSYSDEQLSSNGKDFYSSEPILNIQKMHLTNFSENGDV